MKGALVIDADAYDALGTCGICKLIKTLREMVILSLLIRWKDTHLLWRDDTSLR